MTESTTGDGFEGRLGDGHDLSMRARSYGESVVHGDGWPLDNRDLDLSRIEWATSSRSRRRNGHCAYEYDGRCTITVAEHVYDRASFAACRETVRHELVHAWQHQHAGETATVVDGDVPRIRDEASDDQRAVPVEPGHGPSFRAWVDPLDLEGRCATHYDQSPDDYRYVFACPTCRDWWGRHRLCRSVRQAAHGREGSAGYCYCVDCESLVHLRTDGRYLTHGDHDDDAIRAFVDGESEGLPTTSVDRLTPAARPASDD